MFSIRLYGLFLKLGRNQTQWHEPGIQTTWETDRRPLEFRSLRPAQQDLFFFFSQKHKETSLPLKRLHD